MEKLNNGRLEVLGRYLTLFAGPCAMALGVAFSIRSALGRSPISSLPCAASLFTPLTVGQATIALRRALIALQILTLRKDHRLFQPMRLPVAPFFGLLMDLAGRAVQGISFSAYWQQWMLCITGIFLVAAGASLEAKAGGIVLAGEGFILAPWKVLPVKLGDMEAALDATLATLACILSPIFTGRIQGVREGTAAAAIFVGMIAKRIIKMLEKWKRGEN